MLFAQAVEAGIGWFNAILNLGALGILGYHFLVGLPKLFEQVNTNQRLLAEMIFKDNEADRIGFEARTGKLATELALLREQAKCKYQP